MPTPASRSRRSHAGPLLAAVVAGALALTSPSTAEAFCGFYVAGADAELYADATMVVLMRDGTRTVLSMQNNYRGPAEDFALVVPVPVVLQADDVKILPEGLFERVDLISAPRLVEYWEEDPCGESNLDAILDPSRPTAKRSARDPVDRVTIEAQFQVGEYEIVILSAEDSTGLDSWLRREQYNIPAGAEPLLRPYVQAGMKFFVAKVDGKQVRLDKQGQTMLSPLRFHYDDASFTLPIRLGLINAPDPSHGGKQDLIIHIFAKDRYQPVNYDTVAIPTDLAVADATRERFSEFYASLFDRVLADYPGAIVTEYAWAAQWCDPCPTPPLTHAELRLLGGDQSPGLIDGDSTFLDEGLIHTRLHARFDAATSEDIVFEAASPIMSGLGVSPRNKDGQAVYNSVNVSTINHFQARYIIRHPWTGKVACKDPIYGRWGGPPTRKRASLHASDAAQGRAAARNLPISDYFEPDARESTTAVLLGSRKPAAAELELGRAAVPGVKPEPTQPEVDQIGCAHCSTAPIDPAPYILSLGLLALLGTRRRGNPA